MNLFRLNQWRTLANQSLTCFIVLSVGFNLVACSPSDLSEATSSSPTTPEPTQSIVEVSPPVPLQKLYPTLNQYQPKVTILSPQPDQLLQDNTVTLELDVQNFPIFQEDLSGLGPHLQVILDDRPTQAIYNLDQPLTFEDLEPGTHTIRVFAAYPWDESYKNEAAYDQTVFHLFTRTPSNNPNLNQPLLTLNQPTGTYGAEPILIDFYIANLPEASINSEDLVAEGRDWQVEMTLNGERFLIDQWQPIYIKGVKSGKNWVQLQYLDREGQPLNNVYNNTANVFTYNPEVSNSLSQLFKGELPASQLQAIVDPDYIYEVPTPVSETEEPDENIVEPAAIEESEPLLEEPIVYPIEQTVEEVEEPDSTEMIEEETQENVESPEATIEETIDETIEELETLKELIVEEDNTDSNETVEELETVEESVEESIPEEDNVENLEAVLEETLNEAIEETEILEETVVEENDFDDTEVITEETVGETDQLDNIEVLTEESVDERVNQPDTIEESVVEEIETAEVEADDFDQIDETLTEEIVDERVNQPDTIEESVVEEIETAEVEADDFDQTDEALTEEIVDEAVTETDKTSETSTRVEEALPEETIVEEEDQTEIPEEIVKVDENSDVVSEESVEESQLEQPQSEGWFNSIMNKIKLPFLNKESVEIVAPEPIEPVIISEETSASESIPTKFSELREWLNSILKKIQLPNHS